MTKKDEDMKAKDEAGEKDETMDSLRAEVKDLKEKLSKKEAEGKDVKPEDFVNKANVSEDKDMKKEDGDTKDKMSDVKDYGKDKKEGMDALEQTVAELSAQVKSLQENGEKALFARISRRDSLAKKLLPTIGAFDHKEKTLEEVEQYAVKKLGITCKPGHESSVLDGYLAGRSNSVSNVVTLDSHPACDDVTNYIKGVK
jgi:polyhydroxyalkanoate synthesis regulator phasin